MLKDLTLNLPPRYKRLYKLREAILVNIIKDIAIIRLCVNASLCYYYYTSLAALSSTLLCLQLQKLQLKRCSLAYSGAKGFLGRR